MREVHGHEGSTLNNAITIETDERDENGGSHKYFVSINTGSSNNPCWVIDFQKGPLKESDLNGITDEALLAIVIDRLEGFNEKGRPFACRENACAKTHIEEALHWLNARTKARQARGVEGTHQV